ncbi:MAG: hypothetical protein J6W52_03905 [Bacteroidaceae bacterium]|nr:hypothetical protein [Bacteroidaceae bacterium]
MKRTYFYLLLLIFNAQFSMFSELRAQNAVAIYQVDGQVATFAFEEKPVVTYRGSELVLTTTQTCVQYPIYKLKKMEFTVDWDDPDAIEKVKETDTQFSFRGGQLTVGRGKSGSYVYLYNLKGIKVAQYTLDENGCASIPMQALPQDIYIVKTTGFTFKFRKP